MITTAEVIEFLKKAPTKDYNLFFDFHTKYIGVILSLCEAFKGYAYQTDLFEIYSTFYGEKKMNYSTFSKLLKEIEEQGLIASTDSRPKVLFMTSKGYSLVGRNQSTVHHSRLNNISMERSHKVAQIHLFLAKNIKGYRPHFLAQDKANKHCYRLFTNHKVFIFYLIDESKQQGSESLATHSFKAITSTDTDRNMLFVLVVDKKSKMHDNTITRLQKNNELAFREDLKMTVLELEK